MFNPENNMELLKNKHFQNGKDIQKAKAQREFLVERESTIVSNILKAKQRLEMKDIIKEQLDILQNKTQEKSIGLFTKLLTNMVHDVMPKNKEQEVHFNLSTKRGKPNLDIMMKVGNNEYEDVNSGRGGSLTNVISTGLRYVTLSRTKNRRFMLLDEPDCWLEDAAVPRFARVVSDISRKVGIQTIAISHKNPEFYNSRMIELYRDNSGTVKARVIQETKEDEYIDTDEYEEINRTSLMEDVGIKRIKIQNYMSLNDIDIELSPTMNMIVGENDIGKSAFFSAIRSFVENDCNEGMIQHGKDMFTIEMEIEDGIVLKLDHKRKGQKKTTYQMIMPDGETISEDNGRDVPDFIADALAIRSIDGINIQLAHQKAPVFMIGPDITSSKRAELLSLGRESDYIQRMINIYNKEVKEDSLVLKNGQKELEEIRVKIESLEPVFNLEKRYLEVDKFINSFSERKHFQDRISKTLDELEKNSEILKNKKASNELRVPSKIDIDPNSFYRVNEIIKLGTGIRDNLSSINKIKTIRDIPIPQKITINTSIDERKKLIEGIEETQTRVKNGKDKYKDSVKLLENISSEQESFIKEIGGVCPLCQNQIKHEHNNGENNE